MWTLRPVVVLSLPFILVSATITPASARREEAVGRADPPECRVVNVTRDGSPTANLQAAIDAARRGDTLRIAGTCHGGFVVDKSLTLRGPAGRDRPTLEGGHSERVLTVVGSQDHWISVALRDLRFVRGKVKAYGGGIRSAFANVRLVNVLVWKNEAKRGGGIYSRGQLTLVDTRIGRNRASDSGGIFARGGLDLRGSSKVDSNAAGWAAGIEMFAGHVTLHGRSTVVANEGGSAAGIGLGTASLAMNERTSIRRNIATGSGGGVFGAYGPSIVLNDRSSIHHNVAAEDGGGILTFGRVTLNGHAAVRANVAAHRAGGILAYEPVRLHNHALVARNLAQRGGGMFLTGAPLALSEHALVTGNRAGAAGGGVLALVRHRVRIRLMDQSAIHGNDPENVRVRTVDDVRPPVA